MTQHGSPFDLGRFLRDLGLAWTRLSMYQEGHPARRDVAQRAHAVLAALTATRGDVAVGVKRDGFVSAEETFTGGAPGRLADALYRRNVAVVHFGEGTDAADLETFLAAVPRTVPTDGEPPLEQVLGERGVASIRLESVDLTFVETGDGDDRQQAGASLWDQLLRSLLTPGGAAAGESMPSSGPSLDGLMELIERVLDRHGTSLEALSADLRSGARAADAEGEAAAPSARFLAELGAVIGGALGGAGSGAAAGGEERSTASVGARVAELLDALPGPIAELVLDRALVELVDELRGGAGGAGAVAGLRQLSESVLDTRVLAALRRLRGAGVRFSPSVLGVIDGLVEHAAVRSATAGGPSELAGELRALFADEDVDRQQPTDDEIDRIALDLVRLPPRDFAETATAMEPRLESLRPERQYTDLAAALLDLLVRPFLPSTTQRALAARLGEAFRWLLSAGLLTRAVKIAQRLHEMSADPATGDAAGLALAELRRPESVAALLQQESELLGSSGRMVLKLNELLGPQVLDTLLEAMCEEEDRSLRRDTFDLVVSLGPAVIPRARALLNDPRWYVRRNMLSLLQRIDGGLGSDVLRGGLEHDDPRVRLEAVRALGEADVPAELVAQAVGDADPKVAEAAVAQVAKHRLPDAVGPLVELLEPLDPLGRHRALRLRALDALGRLGEPAALERLHHFLNPVLSPVSGEERRAAYRALAGYPPDAREPWLRKGRWCTDPDVRRICRSLLDGAAEEAS